MATRGTVYLLHFSDRYRSPRSRGGGPRHYLGWTADLRSRLEAHAAGRGARLVEVAVAAGLTFEVARTWPGVDRHFERRLKNHGAAWVCPICTPGTRRGRAPLGPRVFVNLLGGRA